MVKHFTTARAYEVWRAEQLAVIAARERANVKPKPMLSYGVVSGQVRVPIEFKQPVKHRTPTKANEN